MHRISSVGYDLNLFGGEATTNSKNTFLGPKPTQFFGNVHARINGEFLKWCNYLYDTVKRRECFRRHHLSRAFAPTADAHEKMKIPATWWKIIENVHMINISANGVKNMMWNKWVLAESRHSASSRFCVQDTVEQGPRARCTSIFQKDMNDTIKVKSTVLPRKSRHHTFCLTLKFQRDHQKYIERTEIVKRAVWGCGKGKRRLRMEHVAAFEVWSTQLLYNVVTFHLKIVQCLQLRTAEILWRQHTASCKVVWVAGGFLIRGIMTLQVKTRDLFRDGPGKFHKSCK